jgi:hypothetical protein
VLCVVLFEHLCKTEGYARRTGTLRGIPPILAWADIVKMERILAHFRDGMMDDGIVFGSIHQDLMQNPKS